MKPYRNLLLAADDIELVPQQHTESNVTFQNIFDAYMGMEPTPVRPPTKNLIAAGLAVLALDTGRVLMLQRSNDPENNRAPGMWEFPGGNLEEGEDPFHGARREWEEETGEKLPPGQVTGEWTSPNGVYRGFVYQVLDESVVHLNADPERRHVLNPDDPDGDGAEVIAWWEPSKLPRNPAVREEVRRSTDFKKLVAKSPARGYVELLSFSEWDDLPPTL